MQLERGGAGDGQEVMEEYGTWKRRKKGEAGRRKERIGGCKQERDRATEGQTHTGDLQHVICIRQGAREVKCRTGGDLLKQTAPTNATDTGNTLN